MKTGRAVIIGIIVFVLLLLIGSNINDPSVIENTTVTEKTEIEELRGVWVSTAYCLDFPSATDLDENTLKSELVKIVENAKNWGLNAIFFQVRPCSDSFYNSKIYPVSRFLSSEYKLPNGFDPLEYIIQKSHENDIQLHAWINPLRVTTGSAENPAWDVNSLPDGHPAKVHPEYTVPYADGKLYYNVGLPQVRQLIADGVKEIIDNYDVDGIHFDDYFYPYPVTDAVFDDSESYNEYGNGLSIEDYRRNSVNSMITQVYNVVKSSDKNISFGVSPQGIWANKLTDERGSNTGASIQSYTDLFADSLYWIEQGIVDYIAPQIYWSFSQTDVAFDLVYDWWSNIADKNNVKLYAGMAAYKVGTEEFDWNVKGELKKQIDYCRNSDKYDGFIMFRYKFLENNALELRTSW